MKGPWRLVKGPWRLDHIWKGLEAETRIGNAIQYALTASGCAVAHDVKKIAKAGNIDHLVVTPSRIWVIETQAGRVPKKKFPKALGMIAANVKSVRAWAPPMVEVQGCLVIDDGKKVGKKSFSADLETILRHNRRTLMRQLRKEACEPGGAVDEALLRKAWALGSISNKDDG